MNQDAEWGAEEEASGFDPIAQLLAIAQDPLGALKRRWVWMLSLLVVGLIATAALVSTSKPVYQATATVLISGQQIPEHFVRSTVRGDSLENVNAMVGEVLSQRNLSKLIEEHNLFAQLREQSTMLAIIARMRNRIVIDKAKSALAGSSSRGSTQQLFEVTYSADDPHEAAEVTNELASSFVAASMETRNEQARLTTEFLRRELTRAEQELNDANSKITDFQREFRGELPGDLEPSLRKLERLQQQIALLSQQIADKEQALNDLSQQRDGVSTREVILADLRGRLAAQLGVNTEEHPNVIALREQITAIENNKDSSLLELHNSTRTPQILQLRREIENARRQQMMAAAEVDDIDIHVDQIPARQEELAGLQQRADVIRDNYLGFLRKVQEAELAQTLESAQQGPGVTVLDRAQAPGGPIQPRWLLLVIGLLGSFGAALGVGILLEMLDPVVISEGQLTSLAGAPLLGAMPRG